MALPAGINTVSCTFGKRFGALGTQATIEGTVALLDTVRWTATGDVLDTYPEPFVSGAGGYAQLVLPYCDQDGFTDGAGNTVSRITLLITADVLYAGRKKLTVTKPFQITSDMVGPIDIDLIDSGDIVLAVTAPEPKVTSVVGQVNAVTSEQIVEAIAGDLTATFARVIDGVLIGPDGEPIDVGSGGDTLPALSPYPLTLTSTNPNLFAGSSLPTAFTGGFTSIAKNLDAGGSRHLRMAWTYYLAAGTSGNLFLREHTGLAGAGPDLGDHELNYDPTNATTSNRYQGLFEFTAKPATQSVSLFYRSADGTTAVTVTEFDVRQVTARADLIVTNFDPKTTGNTLGHWFFDIPIPTANGATPTTWRAHTDITNAGNAGRLEMGVQSSALFVEDDTYANTGHIGYRGENNFATLGTQYAMNVGNNDFIIGVRVPSNITLETGDTLQNKADGRTYLLRGNVHGGEKGRSGDVNTDFTIEVDRLGDGAWRRITGPAVVRRCRAVRFTAHTRVYDNNTPSRIEIDKIYTFYPDGTFRQYRTMRFMVDTYWCDFFVNMSSYDPTVPLVGKIGQGQKTEGTVDYHGVGSDVQDDAAIATPGAWGVYKHPTAPVVQGQGVDPEQLLAKSRVTGTNTLAIRFQDGGGAKFYQRLYADPTPNSTFPPFDGDDTVGTGSNFFPAGTVLTTVHWGVLYQPADSTYFENEAKAILGRVPQISVRYPAS